MTEEEIPKLRSEYLASFRKSGPKKKKKGSQSLLDNGIDQAEAEAEEVWKDELLDTLIGMSPQAFERLAQRLLREAGVQSPVVTGRSGDGGIDGRGDYRMELLTFPVFFQCKRYKGSVGAFRLGTCEGRWPVGARRSSDHDRNVHQRCQCGVSPRWRTTGRPHRRRPAVRATQEV